MGAELSTSFFAGQAATNAQIAAGLIASTTNFSALAGGLLGAQANLQNGARLNAQLAADPRIAALSDAIDTYVEVVRGNRLGELEEARQQVRHRVDRLPDSLWRWATAKLYASAPSSESFATDHRLPIPGKKNPSGAAVASLHGSRSDTRQPSSGAKQSRPAAGVLLAGTPTAGADSATPSLREKYFAYLHSVQGTLRRIIGSRSYTLAGGREEDKTFLRHVAGGLNTFLGRPDAPNDTALAGMIEEIGAQVLDGGVQSFAADAGVTFPALPQALPVASAVLSEPPVPEPPPATPPPPPPTVVRALFDYHPRSTTESENRHFERGAGRLQARITAENVVWDFTNFVGWVRTLYILAAELPNGSAKRVLSNITRGLSRLNDLTTIESADIRRLLGPASIAVGRSLPGISEDWPRDMSNDFGSALITVWDAGKEQDHEPYIWMSHVAQELWGASRGVSNESEIRGDLKSIMRGVERAILRGEKIDEEEVSRTLLTIAEKIPLAQRPSVEGGTSPLVSPPVPEYHPITSEEWVVRASDFLIAERAKWSGPDSDSHLNQVLGRIIQLIQAENPATERAHDLLVLLFRLTIAYRTSLGVASVVPLVLGRDATVPVGIADRASAYELMREGSDRPDLLQELAELQNRDGVTYPPLLGPEGLPDLVGRYAQYLQDKDPEPAQRVAADFVLAHPELQLTPAMVGEILSYFLGIIPNINQKLLESILREVAITTPPVEVDLEELETEELFRDIDPNKYTDYGRIFIKVVASHRPMLATEAKRFMMFVTTLEKIHRIYRAQLSATGSSNFDRAYQDATQGLSIANNIPYKEKYRDLFKDLMEFLGRHRDVAERVDISLLSGKTQIRVVSGRGPVHAAGGRAVVPAPTAASVPPPPSSFRPKVILRRAAHGVAPIVLPPPDEALSAPMEVTAEPGVTTTPENPFATLPAPASVVPTVLEAPPAATVTTPVSTEVETIIQSWDLNAAQKGALRDLSDATSPEEVASVLRTLSSELPVVTERQGWLDVYAKVHEQNRITSRGKKQMVTLLQIKKDFAQVSLLLRIASVRQTGLSLDQILPEPIQLGKKLGRVAEIAGRGRNPHMVIRPAMTWDEGLYQETAVMPSGASVQVYDAKGAMVDIGLDHSQSIAEISLLQHISQVRGAITGGQRTSFSLIILAPSITPRARRYFFLQHPKESLIVWRGDQFSIYRLETNEQGQNVEKEIHIGSDGNKLPGQTGLFRPLIAELRTQFIGEADKNEGTYRLIDQPTSAAMGQLTQLGFPREATTLKVVRNLVLQEVGFLSPSHPDAEQVITICQKLNQRGLTADQIIAIREELFQVVQALQNRFNPPSAPPSAEARSGAVTRWAASVGLPIDIADAVYKKANALAVIVGDPQVRSLLAQNRQASASASALLDALDRVNTKVGEMSLRRVVEQLASVPIDDMQLYRQRRQVLAAIVCILDQQGRNVTEVSLEPEKLLGGVALTKNKKLIVLGNSDSDLEALIREPLQYYGDDKISGVFVVIVGATPPPPSARDRFWKVFGDKGKIALLEDLQASGGKRYTFDSSRRDSAADILGEENGEGVARAVVDPASPRARVAVEGLTTAHIGFLDQEVRPLLSAEEFVSFVTHLSDYSARNGNINRLLDHLTSIYHSDQASAQVVLKNLLTQGGIAHWAPAVERLADLSVAMPLIPRLWEWTKEEGWSATRQATLVELHQIIGVSTTQTVAVSERLAKAMNISEGAFLEMLAFVLRKPLNPLAEVPRNLQGVFRSLIGGRATDSQGVLFFRWLRNYQLLGLNVAEVRRPMTLPSQVRVVQIQDGQFVTVENVRGSEVSVVSEMLADNRLVVGSQVIDGAIDLGISHVQLINHWGLAAQAGQKMVWVVSSPRGVTERSMRLFFQMQPQGEIVWMFGDQSMRFHLEGEGVVRVDPRTGTSVPYKMALAYKPGDIVLAGLTPQPPREWNPESVDWNTVLTSTEKSRVLTALRELFAQEETSVSDEITYTRLSGPASRLKQRIELAISQLEVARATFNVAIELFPTEQVAEWRERVKALEESAVAAFIGSPTQGEGLAKIHALPEILEEVSEIMRTLLGVELAGYRTLLERLERRIGTSEMPHPLSEAQEALLVLQAKLANETVTLDAETFVAFNHWKGILANWASLFEDALKAPAAPRYLYQSRDDLTLPPKRASYGDLQLFLERYGFVYQETRGRYAWFKNSASGISQKIPVNPDVSGSMGRNYYWYAVRAVEGSERKLGRMAPATGTEVDENPE